MVGVDIPGKVGLVDHDPDKAEFELVEAGQDGRAARDCFWRRLVARYQTLKMIVPWFLFLILPVHIISARPLRSDRPFFQSDK